MSARKFNRRAILIPGLKERPEVWEGPVRIRVGGSAGWRLVPKTYRYVSRSPYDGTLLQRLRVPASDAGGSANHRIAGSDCEGRRVQ